MIPLTDIADLVFGHRLVAAKPVFAGNYARLCATASLKTIISRLAGGLPV
jgi:hypothetical protein